MSVASRRSSKFLMISSGTTPCHEGVINAKPGDAECARGNEPWVLAATILGSSMAFIDGSVVNIALPAIQKDFAASLASMQWIINAYALFLATLILVGGAAGDRFGRRRIFILGIAIFTAASVWCGVAPDALQLIAARAAQGVGGALLVPSSLAIISASFSAHERGKAIGTWAGFSALTAALGPVLGGWLVEAFSWRTIFFINVPLALATMAIALRYVPESRAAEEGASLDWCGALLAMLALGALTYGLVASSQSGWRSPVVLGSLAASAPLFIAFVWNEARCRSPMMPLGLFRSRTFSGVNVMTLLLYFALGGSFFFLPFNLIQVQGYSATQAGAALLPFTIIMGGLSRWAGGLLSRYGQKRPLVVGPTIAAAGFALFAWPGAGGSYWTTFFPAIVVLALGMTISVAPLTTAVINAVDDRYAGTASGVNNAVARTANLLAVALLGAIAVTVFATALDRRVSTLEISPAAAHAVRQHSDQLAAMPMPENVSPSERRALAEATDEAFVVSFRAVMLIAAALTLAGALCAGLMIEADDGR